MIQYESDLKSGRQTEVYHTIVSDFSTFSIGMPVFQVDSCLRTGHPMLMTFNLKVPDYNQTRDRIAAFSAGLRDAMANSMNVSALRFSGA